MRLFILLLSILTATTTQAAVSNADRQIVERGRNLLDNGGFESGRAKWTASGGTFVSTSTAANVGSGSIAGSWDSSAASQTLTSTAVTIPAGMYGRNGVASCKIQGASATHTIQAYDGTNILASTTITSQSAYSRSSINFIFPSSGSVSLRLVSVNANEPTIYIDDCFLGEADGFNVSQINQAELYGSLVYSGVANCNWTSTSASWANFAADTDCTTPTGSNLTGMATAPSTKIPGVTFASLPPGRYMVVVTGQLQIGFLTTATQFRWAISDGTTRSGMAISYSPTASDAASTPGNLNGVFEYTVAQSNITFQPQVIQDSGAGTASIINQGTDGNYRISVYRFPTSSEIAYRPDLINWKVDANISGANPSLGTANQASYIGIEDTSLTLTNNTGSGNITAQIPCSSTNAPTGTTCAVGNESVGVSFTVPTAGDVMACASFAHSVTFGASGVANVAFQLVETAINSQTILQEGKTRVPSGSAFASGEAFNHPYRVCGNFTFSSAGQKAIRLMYEQTITATISSNIVVADASASVGQRDIHWEVYPINQAMPFPVLVGSVTSNTTGQERIESALVSTSCTSTPCTIASQSGAWLTSISRASTGTYTANIAAGSFSSTPRCVLTATASEHSINQATVSTSAVAFNTANSSGTAADSSFALMCMGPR